MAEEMRNMTLTIAGRNLIAKSLNGKGLKLVRVVMGSGKLPEGTNVKDMTAVIEPKLNLPITYFSEDGTGTAKMFAQLNNAQLEHGFFATELGLYAIDPDTEEETLYSYRNTGDYSEYIPAGVLGEILNLEYGITTVVDNAENITVNITEGVGSLPRVEFYNHTKDTNPHPNLVRNGDKITEAAFVYASTGDTTLLERLYLKDLQKQILGTNASTFPVMNGRIGQLEIELANAALRLSGTPKVFVGTDEPGDASAIWIKPLDGSDIEKMLFADLDLSNMVFYDNFNPVQEIDTLKVNVTGITAGSRTIDVASLDGIHPGQWYTVTDGVHSELVQVKSSSKNDGVLRVVCKSDIVNTYIVESTVLCRTTADVTAIIKGGGIHLESGAEIILSAKEFKSDGIAALMFAQSLIKHSTITNGELRAFVTFQDEIEERTDVEIGTATGARQTLTLPDAGIDYNTIRLKVDGVNFTDFSANTETDAPEITLTATAGATITASYRYGYTGEDWEEMQLTALEEYEDSGKAATKFEYALPEGLTTRTRTAIKWRFESEVPTTVDVYAVEAGWAKGIELGDE